MKLILTALLSLFLSSAFAGGATDTVKIQTQTYCDHCKACESCWPRMEKQLVLSKGVKSVSYDDQKMIITVVYNAKKTNPDKIRKEIAKSGFDADDVKADTKAQGRLDGCCKKK